MPYPRSFSHVGISVDDIDQAIDFYTQALGCYLIVEPMTAFEGDGSTLSQILSDALGPGWERLKLAHLTTSDRVGIELFEIDGVRASRADLAQRRTGIFHICVQDPDIEGLAKRIVEHGGKQRMPVRAFHPGEKPYKMVYCEDPFGNIVEIFTNSYELSFSQEAYAHPSVMHR